MFLARHSFATVNFFSSNRNVSNRGYCSLQGKAVVSQFSQNSLAELAAVCAKKDSMTPATFNAHVSLMDAVVTFIDRCCNNCSLTFVIIPIQKHKGFESGHYGSPALK